ncbi:hypothetical protein [Nocardia crassostreae]|uniref:hypothetical protein n=1 Tax=Nocardia crassostreae TaxID=53428 RepID=UPI0008376F5C|nr:hypothetical protein [Nocardia crassostreae]
MDKVSGTCVLAEKFSPQHTSVQWNTAARAACTELTGNGLASHTCSALRASIDAAVAAGDLGVSTRDVDVRTRGWTVA